VSPTDERTRTASERGPRVIAARDIPASALNQDALRVISRLQRQGFEAYLVGGCVRDLMLGRRPKDFDVATSAHPRQVKRLFHHGRIIGRRFRLVHVVFGDHVVETATFRRAPVAREDDPEDLLILEDNEYGTAGEDARRRDFTINALFFDPQRRVILDYVGGLEDLEAGVIRTIGAPPVRFAEDPVRILRAVKFATRLGFRIDEPTWQAMSELAPELARAAKPRVLEEILRLLRSGTALGAFRMLRACGALHAVLPQVDEHLGPRADADAAVHDRADAYWRLLEALDADVHAGNVPTTPVAVAVTFLRLVERAAGADPRTHDVDTPVMLQAATSIIEPFALAVRLSRRDTARAIRVIAQQRRFTQGATKHFRPLLFVRGDDFRESLDLFRLRSISWGQGWDLYEAWLHRHQAGLEAAPEEVEHERKRRRRRRRRGRRREAGNESASEST
jgi:poly(A) polymerase